MPVAVTRSHRSSCADTAVTLHTSQHTAIAHCPAVCHLAMLVICLAPTTGLPLAHSHGSLPVGTNFMPCIGLYGRRAYQRPGTCKARAHEAVEERLSGVACPTRGRCGITRIISDG